MFIAIGQTYLERKVRSKAAGNKAGDDKTKLDDKVKKNPEKRKCC